MARLMPGILGGVSSTMMQRLRKGTRTLGSGAADGHAGCGRRYQELLAGKRSARPSAEPAT